MTSTPSLVGGYAWGQTGNEMEEARKRGAVDDGYLLRLRSIHESDVAERSPLVRSQCCQSLSPFFGHRL